MAKTMTTWRRADNELIYGEFSFMIDYDAWQDEEADMVEEVWELKSSTTHKYEPLVEDDDDE